MLILFIMYFKLWILLPLFSNFYNNIFTNEFIKKEVNDILTSNKVP